MTLVSVVDRLVELSQTSPENPEALAEAHLDLLDGPVHAAALGRAGHQHVAERFQLTDQARGLLDHFETWSRSK